MSFLESLKANPDLPFGLITLAALLLCFAWRKVSPASWERYAAWLPKSDTSKVWNALRKAFQAWPATAIGFALPALATGGDWKVALKGATFGLLAPVLYEAAQLAKNLKWPGGPGGGLTTIVLAFALTGCGMFAGKEPKLPDVTPEDALSVSRDACRVYMALPADLRNDRDDKACQVIMRVCLVPAEPPAELHTEPASLGNKIVEGDAGAP